MELPHPLLIHLDDVGVVLGVLGSEPLGMGMLDQGAEIVRICRVNDVEEVLPVGEICLGPLLGEELGKLLLLHHLANEVDHAQLVVLGHLDGAELVQRDEMLSSSKDLFEKVLGDLLLHWQVELAYDDC